MSSSSGQHLALLLLHSSQQPKMKEKTIPVPSTDGGRAPNDAVNVPSEEVSPNPQQICPVSPGVAISLLHLSVELGSILKAPSCPVCWFHSRSGALGSAPRAAVSRRGAIRGTARFGCRSDALRFPSARPCCPVVKLSHPFTCFYWGFSLKVLGTLVLFVEGLLGWQHLRVNCISAVLGAVWLGCLCHTRPHWLPFRAVSAVLTLQPKQSNLLNYF